MLSHMLNMVFRRGGKSAEGPSFDRILNLMDAHLANYDGLIGPSDTSKPRTPFDSGLPRDQMAMLNVSRRERLRILPKMLPLVINMMRASRLYDRKFVPRRSTATPEFIARLENLARKSGVKDIRYVKVPRYAIFQDKGIPYEYAIVYTVEMDKEPIDSAPSFECQLEVMRGYKNMAVIGTKLSNFLRRHGYAAFPGTALGGSTDYVHLAEIAGLGAIGYHGLLITPGEGARLRINTIYTNIENLPIQTENEHQWVRDFCAMCKKCVRECPVSAIYDEPVSRGDGGMQCIDHGTCREYFARNFGCGVCLAVCPFSRAGYDKVKAHFRGNENAPHFTIPVRATDTTAEQLLEV